MNSKYAAGRNEINLFSSHTHTHTHIVLFYALLLIRRVIESNVLYIQRYTNTHWLMCTLQNMTMSTLSKSNNTKQIPLIDSVYCGQTLWKIVTSLFTLAFNGHLNFICCCCFLASIRYIHPGISNAFWARVITMSI